MSLRIIAAILSIVLVLQVLGHDASSKNLDEDIALAIQDAKTFHGDIQVFEDAIETFRQLLIIEVQPIVKDIDAQFIELGISEAQRNEVLVLIISSSDRIHLTIERQKGNLAFMTDDLDQTLSDLVDRNLEQLTLDYEELRDSFAQARNEFNSAVEYVPKELVLMDNAITDLVKGMSGPSVDIINSLIKGAYNTLERGYLPLMFAYNNAMKTGFYTLDSLQTILDQLPRRKEAPREHLPLSIQVNKMVERLELLVLQVEDLKMKAFEALASIKKTVEKLSRN